jgi:hypothetical protein
MIFASLICLFLNWNDFGLPSAVHQFNHERLFHWLSANRKCAEPPSNA